MRDCIFKVCVKFTPLTISATLSIIATPRSLYVFTQHTQCWIHKWRLTLPDNVEGTCDYVICKQLDVCRVVSHTLRNSRTHTVLWCTMRDAVSANKGSPFLFSLFFRIRRLSSKLLALWKVVIWGTNISGKTWCPPIIFRSKMKKKSQCRVCTNIAAQYTEITFQRPLFALLAIHTHGMCGP